MEPKHHISRRRADKLIAALMQGGLLPHLRRQAADWLLDVPEDGAGETSLSEWARRNVVPHRGAPGRASQRGWRKLSTALGFGLKELPVPARARTNVKRTVMQVAAVFVLAVAITHGVLYLRSGRDAPKVSDIVLTAAAGADRTFILPDGTVVRLMGGSTLTYHGNFTQRNVELDGEAFFEVAHDVVRPLVVGMERMSVRALGTEFYINGRNENTTEVILLEGGVRVDVGTENCVMHPYDKLVVDRAGGHIVELTKVSLGQQMRVSGSGFNIFRMPAREVLRTTADYFGMPFEVEDDVPAGEPISLIARDDTTLEEILTSINQLSPNIVGRVENGTLIATGKTDTN